MHQPSVTAPPRRRAILVAAALCCLLACAAVWSGTTAPLAPSRSGSPPLTILWDQELLSDPSPAMDVRWATAQSVYIAWFRHGVTQLALDGNFTALHELFPGATTQSPGFDVLAVSQQYIVASSRWTLLAFRSPPQERGGNFVITTVPVGLVQDIDLSGNRLLLLGAPEPVGQPLSGGVAWLGPLTDHPMTDLKPILYDISGVKTTNLGHCSRFIIGAARFLPDGSFVVVPGFQPGAHLFDSAGQLLRTWDTKALGVDGDAGCSSMTDEQHYELGVSSKARGAYINQHRVVDGILPLARGPGLIVRSVAEGKVHWQIVVLQAAGTVTYDVPFTGSLPYDRLRGDVQGNRIVLLRAAHEFDKKTPSYKYPTTHLYVAELPQVVDQPADPQAGREREEQ
jgi:hypothetical protein